MYFMYSLRYERIICQNATCKAHGSLYVPVLLQTKTVAVFLKINFHSGKEDAQLLLCSTCQTAGGKFSYLAAVARAGVGRDEQKRKKKFSTKSPLFGTPVAGERERDGGGMDRTAVEALFETNPDFEEVASLKGTKRYCCFPKKRNNSFCLLRLLREPNCKATRPTG